MELKVRTCQNCERDFKVLATSQQTHCSLYCQSVLGQKSTAKKKGNGISFGTGIQSLEKRKSLDLESVTTVNVRNITPKRKNTMQKIESGETASVPVRQNLIVTERMLALGKPTEETEPTDLEKSTLGEIKETQIVSYDDTSSHLQRGSLDSMSLLKESANRLMSIMKESISDSDLQKSKEGVGKIEPHRIETAINIANAIASTVQTQANLLKSLTGIIKSKE